jgi:hypothetical protein
MSQPRTGGCLCGAIRYETVGDPVFCHRLDCQRQSGAAQVPVARVPSAGFRILQGTPRRYVTKADSGNEAAGTKWHLRLNQKARKWASKII